MTIYHAVDCLGFAGGFTLGTVQSGFQLVGKRELPGGFGVPNCEANRHLLGDAWQTEIGEWQSWTPLDVDYVFGNPPCSGFSLMTDKRFRGVDAKVNACMWAFVNYAAMCRPKAVVFESVQPAFKSGHELMTSLHAKLEEDTGWRYNLYHVLHNAYDLGGAAVRKRYFWTAIRDDVAFGVDYPVVRPPVLRDVWLDLDGLEDTWEPQPYRRMPTWWSRAHVRSEDAEHVDGHKLLNTVGVQRILDLMEMANKNGGWPVNSPMSKMAKHVYDSTGTLPESWLHKLDRLKSRDFDMGFTQPYRWNDQKPARVIIGGALHLVIHPWRDRMISHREAARVMGFPDTWTIDGIARSSQLHMTWGKGITVQCGRWISSQVRNALDGNPGSVVGQQIGDREWVIDRTGKQYDKVPVRQRDTVQEAPNHNHVDERTTGDDMARTRPQRTVEQDRQVYDVLAGADNGMSRDAIAQQLGWDAKYVYASLYRMRKHDGTVTKEDGKNLWHVIRSDENGAAAPNVEAPAFQPAE